MRRDSWAGLADSLFDERILDRNRTVLVTGGTGYLGKSLVRALLKRGFILNLLVRENSSLSGLEGCNFFLGDIADPDSIRPALENCAFVFHLAARVRLWSPNPAEFDQVNVQGYENLLQLCAEAGVKKILRTSSFIVFGPSNGGVHTEESRCNVRPFGDYDRTLILAEDLTEKYRGQRMSIITLYPTFVYGPGEKTRGNLLAQMIQTYSRGWMRGLLGGASQKWNFVHVDDVVDGHLAAMRRGGAPRYILGGENTSLAEFLELVAGLQSRKRHRMNVPLKLARSLTYLEELRARWSDGEPRVTRQTAEILASHWAFSSERAERELNYRPRPLAVGLKESIEWIRRQ
ncbi:MAG: NAD-dependent epimerase/dehydratase family protein [Acidobacteria bacterium]|nr:NAD-dependent epimerase/dehydratase family protein [Acidobacteriota bacterium]